MYKLDSWLIAQLERFCHWTQRLCGITSVDWMRLCLLVSMFFVGVHVHLDAYKKGWISFAMLALWFCTSFFEVRKLGTMNSNKRFVVTRLCCLLPVPVFFIVVDLWDWDFSYEFMVLAMYLDSCDDLPYAPSKLRLFLKSLRQQPVIANAES